MAEPLSGTYWPVMIGLVTHVPPQEAFALACGRELKLGKQLTVHLAQHYTKDALWREKRRSCRIQPIETGSRPAKIRPTRFKQNAARECASYSEIRFSCGAWSLNN